MNYQKAKRNIITHTSLAAMMAAAFISLVELQHARGHQTLAAVNTMATGSTSDHPPVHGGETMRREKEEIRHYSVSYGVTMRSHPTAGAV